MNRLRLGVVALVLSVNIEAFNEKDKNVNKYL